MDSNIQIQNLKSNIANMKLQIDTIEMQNNNMLMMNNPIGGQLINLSIQMMNTGIQTFNYGKNMMMMNMNSMEYFYEELKKVSEQINLVINEYNNYKNQQQNMILMQQNLMMHQQCEPKIKFVNLRFEHSSGKKSLIAVKHGTTVKEALNLYFIKEFGNPVDEIMFDYNGSLINKNEPSFVEIFFEGRDFAIIRVSLINKNIKLINE